MSKKKTILLLYLILLLGGMFRFFGLNWDSGFHLHPDERAIVIATTALHFPTNLKEFLSTQSSWNTHFFAYGSFPFYLLRIVADNIKFLDPKLATYDGLQLVGRFLSLLFDIGSIVLIFFIGKKLRNIHIGLLAAFFYSIAVLPIQLSHFFAVDTILTFIILLILYLLCKLNEKPTFLTSLYIGICLGFALATKISATVILVSIFTALVVDFLFIFLSKPHKIHHWLPHFPLFFIRLIKHFFTILVAAILTYIILSPYTLIDSINFQRQTLEQSRMTHDAFTFPYTLQYVGKIPYVYELTQIFFYGLGPILGIFSILGFFYFLFTLFEKQREKALAKDFIILTFFLMYLIVVGSFAVGFMRYMLPLYPILCFFAANLLFLIAKKIKEKNTYLLFIFSIIFIALLLLWPLSFINIYTKQNTRIAATNWINQHIPAGKTIALEHWDDGLPLSGIEKYQIKTLPMYEPESIEKWRIIGDVLNTSDYIIIASNRLYIPLQKLSACNKLPLGRCYSRSAAYYQSLFRGSLGYKKVAEFSVYPTIPFTNIKIDDQGADESFTVYDRPKIMIFKKTQSRYVP